MNRRAGIRREDKNEWERRAPIIPAHVAELAQAGGLEFVIQPSTIRAIPGNHYEAAGAQLREDLSECPVVFAVKEIPLEFYQPGGVYVFFAHVIKGQPHNMPMLQRMLDLGCTLIDYEKIADGRGRRLIFFGRYAGMAGMVDTLWALGQRLDWEGIPTPFSQIEMTHRYRDSAAVRAAVKQAGEQIARRGLPESLVPLVFGFAGYGNVSLGAQGMLDLLPIYEIEPEALPSLARGEADRHKVYKVVFKEVHTVRPRDPGHRFDLAEFFDQPNLYESQFEQYLPHLTVLINAIYWTPSSPQLVTKACLRKLYGQSPRPKLRIIGDISCDIEGGVQATVRSTEPDQPVYVYDPGRDQALTGIAGNGPVIMAVDNLPCELPLESSADFSTALKPFVQAIVTADYTLPFDQCRLPPEIKQAVIAYQGQLTPSYRYIAQHL